MQTNRQPRNQLEVITQEIREIFDLVATVPYENLLKAVALNGILEGESESAKNKLKGIMEEQDVTEESLKSANVLNRMIKVKDMVYAAYINSMPSNNRPEGLAEDDILPVLAELIKISQENNHDANHHMLQFFTNMSRDIAGSSYGLQRPGFELTSFYAATKAVTDNLWEEQEKAKVAEKIAAIAKLPGEVVASSLPAAADNISNLLENYNNEILNSNGLLDSYRQFSEAIVQQDINMAIKALAVLGERWSEVESYYPLIPSALIDELPELNFLQVINSLQQSGIYSNSLLENGLLACRKLLGEERFDQALSTTKNIDHHYIDQTSAAIYNWHENDFSLAPLETSDSNINNLYAAINKLKDEAVHFDSPARKLRVINLASGLQAAVNNYIVSNKDESAQAELKQAFHEKITKSGIVAAPLTFKERLKEILILLERIVKNNLTIKSAEHFSFYKARRNVVSKIDQAQKLIQNIESANDKKFPNPFSRRRR